MVRTCEASPCLSSPDPNRYYTVSEFNGATPDENYEKVACLNAPAWPVSKLQTAACSAHSILHGPGAAIVFQHALRLMLPLAQVKMYLHGKGTDSARRIQIQQSKGTAIIFALADNEACSDTYMGKLETGS